MADMAEETKTEDATSEETSTEGGTGGSADETLQAQVDKWKAMARKHEAQAKANAAAAKKLDEIEDASKSEVQRLTDSAMAAENRAAEAEARVTRYEVALEKGVPSKLMKFLAGGTREEVEASADELLAAVKNDEPDTGSNGKGASDGGRPREALRGGASNQEEPEEDDPRAIVAKIPRDKF